MMKRGQITAFIVVGILILFAVGFVLYAASLRPGLNIFGKKETEIEQYIGSCVEQTAQQAIIVVGATGGYWKVPDNIRFNDRAYFSFAARTEPKIPLWYYRGEARVPTRSFITGQITDYVLQNINPCFNNFDPFKQQFAITKKGNLTINTTITDNNVLVIAHYPLELKEKQTGALSTVGDVARTLDVKLGRIYSMAIDILRTENRYTFFENLTMELLSSSSDVPFTGMDFDCSPKTWRKSQVIDFTRNMVFYNAQRVTVEGNRFSLFDTSDQYARNHLVFPMEKTYPDINAAFLFSRDERLELHVRPNDREIIQSNVGRSQDIILRALCINTWHNTYDIEYPLLVSLKDDAAFGGIGFNFNFGFPVTINHNAGVKQDVPIIEFESPDFIYSFCQSTADIPVDVRVKDFYTDEEIYGAPVEYKCVRLLCDLGDTKADGSSYRLMAKMPLGCTNGLLSSQPEGYLEGSTIYDGSDHADIHVKPLKKFKVKVLTHDSDDFSRSEDLRPGEMVSIEVTGISDEGIEQFYTTNSTNNEIELIDGDAKYHIDALLVEDGKRLIGGYVGDWDAKYDDLADKSTVTFHLVQKIPIAVTDAEQEASAGYLYQNTSYQAPLKPTFS